MILKRLLIRKTETWEGPKGQYTGSIEFMGESGDITVNLDAKQIANILPIVAEAIVEESRKLARLMTSEIIEQVTALPAPTPTNQDDPY